MSDSSPPANPRPIYHSGQLLQLDDFNAEQRYHVIARTAQTRRLFTAGVLDGLTVEVVTAPRPANQPQGAPDPVWLSIAPGAALDDQGQLILLSDAAQGPVTTTNGVQVNLARPELYTRGLTRTFVVALSFDEAPSPTNPGRKIASPLVALTEGDAAPADAVVLAQVAVTAPAAAAAPQPGETASPPPDYFALDVVVRPGARQTAALSAERLPPLPADGLIGQVPAARISGALARDQIPPLPAAWIIDWPPITADQLPPLPADRLQGVLSVDQIPSLPACKIAAWPAITPELLPQIPAGKVQGLLAVEQLPHIPATLIAGPLTADQLPQIPAQKVQGPLAAEQLPAIPAALIVGALTADQLPPIPPALIAAPLDLRQLPRIPASQIDGLPDPADELIATSRIAGPLDTAQIPSLVAILRRLDALEGRSPSVEGRAFGGDERVTTSLTTAQQQAYRENHGGASCPNDLADVLADGFTFQALVRTQALTGDNPLACYRFEDPAAAGGRTLPSTAATALSIVLRDGAPNLQTTDAVTGAVDMVTAATKLSSGAWTLITGWWRNGIASVQVEDGPAVQGSARAWTRADGRFDFAADGLTGFDGEVAWFALWKGALDARRVAQTPRRPFASDEISAWSRQGLAGYWPLTGLTGTAVPDLTPVADNGTLGPISTDVPGARPRDLVLEQVAHGLQLSWRLGVAPPRQGYRAVIRRSDGQTLPVIPLMPGDLGFGPQVQGVVLDLGAVVAGESYVGAVAVDVPDASQTTVGPLTVSELPAPSNVTVAYEPHPAAITVQWTSPADPPGGFAIQAWTVGDETLISAEAGPTERSIVIGGAALEKAGGWRLRVGSRSEDRGQTVWSGPPAVLTVLILDRPEPTSLAWDAASGLVARWTPVSGAEGYQLRLLDEQDQPVAGAQFAQDAFHAAPEAVMTGPAFAARQLLSFQVRALARPQEGPEIQGPWSEIGPACRLSLPDIAPIDVVARQEGEDLLASWNPGPSATRPYETRLSDPSGAPVDGVTTTPDASGLAARFAGPGLFPGGRYLVGVHAVDRLLASDWINAPEVTFTPPPPPSRPTAFAGIYLTDVQWWGGAFDPLIIDVSGDVSLGGAPLRAVFDPATSRLRWDWTDMRNTRTRGDIVFAGSPGDWTFYGSINPRPQDGPVGIKSVAFQPPPAPFFAEAEFSGPHVQTNNLEFIADRAMGYNTQYGGWRITQNGGGFRIVFHLPTPMDLRLKLYNCTSSMWPRPGFSPVSIQLNQTTIQAAYDPAKAHVGSGADLTNYLGDTFALPASALVTGVNTLTFTLLSHAQTHYWIRDLVIQT